MSRTNIKNAQIGVFMMLIQHRLVNALLLFLNYMKKISAHDRKRLRNLYVLLDRYDNKQVKENLQRQIDEIKNAKQ